MPSTPRHAAKRVLFVAILVISLFAILLIALGTMTRTTYAIDAADVQCPAPSDTQDYSCTWPGTVNGKTCLVSKPCMEAQPDCGTVAGGCVSEGVCHATTACGKSTELPSTPVQSSLTAPCPPGGTTCLSIFQPSQPPAEQPGLSGGLNNTTQLGQNANITNVNTVPGPGVLSLDPQFTNPTPVSQWSDPSAEPGAPLQQPASNAYNIPCGSVCPQGQISTMQYNPPPSLNQQYGPLLTNPTNLTDLTNPPASLETPLPATTIDTPNMMTYTDTYVTETPIEDNPWDSPITLPDNSQPSPDDPLLGNSASTFPTTPAAPTDQPTPSPGLFQTIENFFTHYF